MDPTPDISPGPSWIKIEDDGTNISSNCIVKNNISNTISVTGSTITGNNLLLATNTDYDSHFVDNVNYDFHLTQSSAAIDNADGAVAPIEDLEGNFRPSGNGYDIGAYEYTSPSLTDQIDDNKNIVLYPNPFVDILIIQGEIKNASIKVFDILGKLLYDDNIDKMPVSINLKNLKPGVHILLIKDNIRLETYKYKIIKK